MPSIKAFAESFWGSWISGLLLILAFVGLFLFWWAYVPSPGKAVAALAVAAAIMTFRREPSGFEKFGWMAALFGFLFIEVLAIDNDRFEHDQQEAKRRSEETTAFDNIAKGLTTSITNNQRTFNATIERLQFLAGLSKESIDEATGGRSFCYLLVSTVPQGILANLIQSGKHPVFQVGITITDVDAFDAALKAGNIADPATYTRGFPIIDFVSRVSLFHPLTIYSVTNNEIYKRYNATISARNGVFQELIRVRRTKDGWVSALLVIASYFSGRHGILLEKINPTFPRDMLETDRDWNTFKKLPVITMDH